MPIVIHNSQEKKNGWIQMAMPCNPQSYNFFYIYTMHLLLSVNWSGSQKEDDSWKKTRTKVAKKG